MTVMSGWRPAWQGVTNTLMQRGTERLRFFQNRTWAALRSDIKLGARWCVLQMNFCLRTNSAKHIRKIKAELTNVMAAGEAFRPEDDRFFRWAMAYPHGQTILSTDMRIRATSENDRIYSSASGLPRFWIRQQPLASVTRLLLTFPEALPAYVAGFTYRRIMAGDHSHLRLLMYRV